MKSPTRGRSLLALGATAIAVGLLLPLGLSAAASADTINTDPDTTGAIIVHKYSAPTWDQEDYPADGQPLADTPSGAVAIRNVNFKAQKINGIDLSQNADWEKLQAFSAVFNTSNHMPDVITDYTGDGLSLSLDTPGTSGTTDDLGATTLGSLPIGVYYVTELASPGAQVLGADGTTWESVTVTPAQPFIVTVPITASNDTWDYSVDVYPKNGTTGIPTKTVDTGNATKLGDTVTYTIRGDISGTPTDVNENGEIDTDALPNGALEATYIDGFKFVDPLDARLGYDNDNAPLTVQIGTVDGTTGAFTATGAALEAGVDYELSEAPGSDQTPPKTDDTDTPWNEADTNYITVLFLQPGLNKLMANNGQKVQITLPATVKMAGEIENTVTQYPNLGSFDTGGITSPPTTAIVKFGDYTVLKTKASNGDPLPGAVFEVYTKLLTDGSGKVDPDYQVKINEGTADEVSQWTSHSITLDGGATGMGFTINGLRYSGWNGDDVDAALDPDHYITYYLVEVQAPDGYALQAAPIPFTVGDDTSTTNFSADNVAPYPVADWTVVNVNNNGGFTLPLTGAGGTALFATIGLLVAGLGLVLSLRVRNRSRRSELTS